jgi:hypothetical protein
MSFIIDQFKKAGKGDSFRTNEKSDKYNDKIAQLNSLGSNQYSKVNTNSLNRISKTTTSPTSTKGGTLPGA